MTSWTVPAKKVGIPNTTGKPGSANPSPPPPPPLGAPGLGQCQLWTLRQQALPFAEASAPLPAKHPPRKALLAQDGVYEPGLDLPSRASCANGTRELTKGKSV